MNAGVEKAARPRLLEREGELAAIGAALERLKDGTGSLVIVNGPAGIGKTALLAAAGDLAADRGLMVRRARGGELERELPFGIVRQLFEPVLHGSSAERRERLLAGSARHALVALGPEDSDDVLRTGDPFAPLHGLYWLVANLADECPLVLAIDDAHWSDTQTLQWLEYLSRRLGDIAVVVMTTVREGEPDPPRELEPLRLEAELIYPAPLSAATVADVIEAQLQSRPTPRFAAACVKASGGNPLLLSEVLRTLRSDGVEPADEAADAVAQLGLDSVARYVLIRLGRFGDEAIALARAIAVLGGSPQLRHAAGLSGVGEERARELCDRLREAEILAPGLPIEFVHPLVREAIYREQPEDARSAAHRRAAEILGATGSEAREIAPHLLVCAPNGDQWVVARLREAASQASAAGAPASAEQYLERALAEPPELELHLLGELGVAQRAANPVSVPEALIRVANEASDRRLRIRAMRHLSFACYSAGDLEGSMRWNQRLLDETPATDGDRRARVEAQLFLVGTFAAGRTPASSRRIASVVASADPSTRGGALARQALSWDRCHSCGPVQEVLSLAASFPGVFGRDIAPPLACFVLAWSGRWDDARLAAGMAVEGSRQAGLMPELVASTALLADVDRLAGRLPESEAGARSVLGILDDLAPGSFPRAVVIVAVLGVLIARGDLSEAATIAARHLEASDLPELPPLPTPTATRGYLRLGQGALEEGVDCLLAAGQEAGGLGFLNPAVLPWRQEAAPALAALGRTTEAKELIAVAEERAQRFGAAHVVGAVLRGRALIEPKSRQVETLQQSVAALEEYGPPHELARSLVELGAALRRAGSRSESREPLRRGLELAHASGAGGIERRAREELAAVGSRPRSVFRSGAAALTASERRTAKLAAEGLSNVEIAQRLFVTRKTVEKHLSNAYGKLEISSREDLPGALRETTGT